VRIYTPQELDTIRRDDPVRFFAVCGRLADKRMASPNPHMQAIGRLTHEAVERGREHMRRRHRP
jgi:hypothetical protein